MKILIRGDPLSMLLFNLVLETIIRDHQLNRDGKRNFENIMECKLIETRPKKKMDGVFGGRPENDESLEGNYWK